MKLTTLAYRKLANGSFHKQSDTFTAQRRVATTLAQEILDNSEAKDFPKGTFAHGQSTQVNRNFAVLLKSPLTEKRALAEIIRGAHDVVSSLRSALLLISVSPKEWQPELAGALAGVIVIPDGIAEEDLESLKNRNLPFLLIGETNLPGPRIPLDKKKTASSSDCPWYNNDIEYASEPFESNFFNIGKFAVEFLRCAFLTGDGVGNWAVRQQLSPT
jgi:DNA-binding LacI/PurR family transcriptional regulator